MGIVAEVPENVFRTAERPLAVCNPFVAEQVTNKGTKGLEVGQMPEFAVEFDLALPECFLESLDELGPENEREHFVR